MESLPIELLQVIHGFIGKLDSSKNITSKLIKNKALEDKKMCLVNKDFYSIYKQSVSSLKTVYHLINKYKVYQIEYEKEPVYSWDKYCYQNTPSPIIYDIVLTGCNLPFAKSTFEYLSSDVIDDLNKAIKILPESINYHGGYLRCRNCVSVLHAACTNEKIPMYIIKLLLKNGIDKKHKILVNGGSTDILDDLEANISSYRFNKTKKLFNL